MCMKNGGKEYYAVFSTQSKCYIIFVAVLIATMQSCEATVDTSNLDFKSFRFFRYINRLPNGDFTYARAPQMLDLSDYISHGKAVAVYFRGVVLGNTGYEARSVPFVFHPTAEHLREKFQQKHGYRGEKLVEQLGNGEYLHSHYKWSRGHWYPKKAQEIRSSRS